MRLAPLRRPNHYQGIQIDHRPTHNSSPYEKTVQKLFSSPGKTCNPTPASKCCKLCFNKISFGSSSTLNMTGSSSEAVQRCKVCGQDICKSCTRKCESCEEICCYICHRTIFRDTATLSLCSDCN